MRNPVQTSPKESPLPTHRAKDFYCDEVFSGRTSVEKVVETAAVLAFRHTRPSFQTHVMVVPKRHISSLLDPGLTEAEILEIVGVLRSVASGVVSMTGACRLVTNLGDYQDSKHLHWHVVAGERKESGLPWP